MAFNFVIDSLFSLLNYFWLFCFAFAIVTETSKDSKLFRNTAYNHSNNIKIDGHGSRFAAIFNQEDTWREILFEWESVV